MMERALKERIIGAIVLVVFVVLVVPIFLDGPPENGESVSERVLLPGQEEQDITTVVLDRERSEPIPTANRPQADESADVAAAEATVAEAVAAAQDDAVVAPPLKPPNTQSTELTVRTEPPPADAEEGSAATPTASTTGMWAVQLGSFSNRENAEKLAAGLRKQGYAAFLSKLETSSGPLHRVRIGPQKNRESAEQVAARLLKADHKGQVLPHP